MYVDFPAIFGPVINCILPDQAKHRWQQTHQWLITPRQPDADLFDINDIVIRKRWSDKTMIVRHIC